MKHFNIRVNFRGGGSIDLLCDELNVESVQAKMTEEMAKHYCPQRDENGRVMYVFFQYKNVKGLDVAMFSWAEVTGWVVTENVGYSDLQKSQKMSLEAQELHLKILRQQLKNMEDGEGWRQDG